MTYRAPVPGPAAAGAALDFLEDLHVSCMRAADRALNAYKVALRRVYPRSFDGDRWSRLLAAA